MADLVAGRDDRLHGGRIAVGGKARDEEGRAQVMAREHPQDPRHADLGAIGLVAHCGQPSCVAGIDGENGRLGVDVEREGKPGPGLAWPKAGHRAPSVTACDRSHKGTNLQHSTIGVGGTSNALDRPRSHRRPRPRPRASGRVRPRPARALGAHHRAGGSLPLPPG